MRTVERLFEMFDGSPTRVAKACGVTKQRAAHWLKRGRVPAELSGVVEAATGGRISEVEILRELQLEALEKAERKRMLAREETDRVS